MISSISFTLVGVGHVSQHSPEQSSTHATTEKAAKGKSCKGCVMSYSGILK